MICAVAVLPVPPLAELTVTELVSVPVAAPLASTFTVTVQLAPPASDAPLRLTLPLPAVAVAVPPQVLFSPLGVATTSPVGSVSMKLTPVSVTPDGLGLLSEKLSVVVLPTAIFAAPNDLLMLGGWAETVKVFVSSTLPGPPHELFLQVFTVQVPVTAKLPVSVSVSVCVVLLPTPVSCVVLTTVLSGRNQTM